ncbi:uncharacterized protein LOC132270468 [Cornus florida]|uniref:uncharacterized protein LOC132270468 n=1 Tax=Cornus florida TaxID=4283 RepID=UPI0028A21505|nr:uncharacterized protein LOC132270468 [Cornus florida]
MKKDVPFTWDQACQNALDNIKKYLLNAPVLGAPTPGKPLVLYIAAQEESLGALLAQNNEENKEKALYYLSRRLTATELKYPSIEKTFKGQALADFLADHPISADWEIFEDFPDEEVFFVDVLLPWMMFFDDAARSEGAGAGVVFISPQRQILPYTFSFPEKCSNNMAEYQALIIGLQMANEMKISNIEVYGDSKLDNVVLEHVPREENRLADALANLATAIALGEAEAITVPVCQQWVLPQLLEGQLEETNEISIRVMETEDWR